MNIKSTVTLEQDEIFEAISQYVEKQLTDGFRTNKIIVWKTNPSNAFEPNTFASVDIEKIPNEPVEGALEVLEDKKGGVSIPWLGKMHKSSE